MAVISISKIQVRRGLQENLPQLASAEFGWSIDERRLYIGNGTLSEGAPTIGNTEILTQNSDVISAIKTYVFRGDESGYTSKTGPTVSTFVQRSLQHKIDEQISLRDFITVDDVDSDDYTISLQRAINEIFPIKKYADVGVRRVLHIPAGVYKITAPIILPPYASIVGDGPLSTIIQQIGSVGTVFEFCDSLGQRSNNPNFGKNGAQLPSQINISNLMLENAILTDLVLIDSATNVNFDRVNFKGSLLNINSAAQSAAGVKFLGTHGPTSRISFIQCEFAQLPQGWTIVGDVSGVAADDCVFRTLIQAVTAESTTVNPRSIKIVASTFDNIAQEAIVSNNSSSIISAYNYYKNVGYGLTSAPLTAVLSWASSNNYSIADTFDRSLSDQAIRQLVAITGSNQSETTQITAAGSAINYAGRTETLTNDTTADTLLILPVETYSAIVDYSIVRGTAKRIGTLKVAHVSGTVIYEDDYTEVGDTKVTLDFNTIGENSVLAYTSENIGSTATLNYTLRSFT